MPEFEEARRRRLRDHVAGCDAEWVLVTDLTNVRYLTGFTGSSGALVCGLDGTVVLATDSRYAVQVGEQAPDVEHLITRETAAALLDRVSRDGPARVLFESQAMTVAQHQRLVEGFSAELVPDAGGVTTLRMVKDALELERVTRACLISDEALADVLPTIAVGVREIDLARRLDEEMRDRTLGGPGFATIVASGPNSAIPHHSPTHRAIEAGDLLKIDFGAQLEGYHADMTRTFVVGAPPTPWQQEIYDVVATAQEAGIQALAPDETGVAADRAARTVIEQAGWGEHFGHGLGHGVGLQIHEAPFLGPSSTDRLAAAVPVTVEPGIYLPGRGGVRIEDTVVVQRDRVERLTTTTRELTVLG